MTRRPGITLLEVLVAIFITGIGLLALLTLFPLGAMEMAQSVKDDRCGHIKHNAAAMANIWDIRSDPFVLSAMLDPANGMGSPPPGVMPPLNPANSATASLPSYPVLVDPIGWNVNQSNPAWQNWVGGVPFGGPRRVTIQNFHPSFSTDPFFASNAKLKLYNAFVFQDDIDFRHGLDDYAGMACPPGGLVDRTPRDSVAYLCQMPRVGNIDQSVDLTVIVYSGRALDEPGTGETIYSAAYNPATNSVLLSWPAGQDPPDVGVGNWIMDGSMTMPPRGKFYRVVGVTPQGPNALEVEVLQTLQNNGNGIAIIMSGVVEVFLRGDY